MSTKYIASNWRLPNQAGVDSYLNDNYGLTFDGSSERISTGSTLTSLGISTEFSVSFWFNSTDLGLYDTIINAPTDHLHWSSGFGFSIVDSKLRFWVNEWNTANFFTETSTLSINTWYHAVGTFNTTDGLKLYLNAGTPSTASNTSLDGLTNQIGIGSSITSYHFDGSISEVAIFDYALTESQVSTLYGSSSLGAGNPLALKPAPVAYYNLADNSSGNPLTQPNEAVEDASVFEFDSSSSQFIDVPTTDSINFTSAFSTAMWFKTTSTGSMFTSHGTSSIKYFIQWTGSSNRIRLRIYDSANAAITIDNIPSQDFDDGNWHHLVFTTDGTTSANKVIIYLNGQELSTKGTLANTGIKSVTGSLKIGALNDGSNTFDGQLSNFQAWNTELSASEVTTLYNSGVPLLTGTQPQASNLKAWYKLDQTANWEADTSGAWQIPDAVSAYPQSFDFDASNNEKITANNITSLNTGDLSASIWVFATNSGNNIEYLFDNSNALANAGFTIAINSSNGYAWYIGRATTTYEYVVSNVNINFTNNVWNHLCLSYNDTTKAFVLYLNGNQVNSGTATSVTKSSSTNPITIGGQHPNYDFTGKLSNAQIWQAALSSTEVETLYNNGVPLTTAIASDNLKAWYKLDNTATFSTNWSVPDASGNGNTGTSSGMTEQNLVNNNVSALNGESSGMTSANLVLSDLSRNLPYDSYSFNFDAASSDYIDCGNDSSLEITGNFTLSAWVNLNTMSSYRRLIGKQEGVLFKCNYGLGFFGGYQPGVIANDGTTWFTNYSSNPLSTGVWHHIVGIYDGSNFILYVNGSLDNTTSVSGFNIANAASLSSGSPVLIGARENVSELFNGKISNVSIFDEALTSTEVLKLYSNGMPQDLSTFTPAPIAWWTLGSNSFFNGSNFICKDLIGSNDGTSVNAGVDALQGNTPRSEANGTGTNMDIPTNLEGSTKYSSNNSYSINMSNTARVQDTP